MAHIAIFTSDIAKARDFYGALLGYQEPFLLSDAAGNLAFNVKDPDGHTVEFVPYTPQG